MARQEQLRLFDTDGDYGPERVEPVVVTAAHARRNLELGFQETGLAQVVVSASELRVLTANRGIAGALTEGARLWVEIVDEELVVVLAREDCSESDQLGLDFSGMMQLYNQTGYGRLEAGPKALDRVIRDMELKSLVEEGAVLRMWLAGENFVVEADNPKKAKDEYYQVYKVVQRLIGQEGSQTIVLGDGEEVELDPQDVSVAQERLWELWSRLPLGMRKKEWSPDLANQSIQMTA